MNFSIRLSSNLQSDLSHRELEQILTNSLSRFQHRLTKAFVFIHDVNGPRGGVDKQCRCVLHLKGMRPVVIQDQDESVTTLIYRVANRASHAISRQTDRRNKRGRRTRHDRNRLEAQIEEALESARVTETASASDSQDVMLATSAVMTSPSEAWEKDRP